ncbi:MAG: exodeoxyribonuclease VII large subunit [Candidatus Eremiobacteraeota bacterium]|nr:exodeoxyribonuclease VII large subunit [Candidatus Eremiobacteraeota bacterium]
MSAPQTEPRIVSVSRLANFIEKMFVNERRFVRLGVRGEVTNLKEQANGNVYFDLKDREALLNCIAFSQAAGTFPAFSNGEEIVAIGTVGTYARASRYQLRVVEVHVGGEGALHQRYEALKRRLSAEGLFDESRRRPLPRYPFRVALVTSRSAEGARDFVSQAAQRAPHVEIVLVETPVQGERAAPEIVRAIRRAATLDVDLIVLARGGGSFEDLFAFSNEGVVRAVAASPVPTVSAIGHEIDAPLTDFVADRRAATPSAAAQTVLPRRDDLLAEIERRWAAIVREVDRRAASRRQHVDSAAKTLQVVMHRRVRLARERLTRAERGLAQLAPAARLERRRGRFEQFRERLARSAETLLRRRAERYRTAAARIEPAMRLLVERRRAMFATRAAGLEANNPEAILARGYAVVRTADGRLVRDAAVAPPGTRITATLARGALSARVEGTQSDGGRQIDLF